MNFQSKHPHYEYLQKKFSAREQEAQENFFSKHNNLLKQLTLGGLGGLAFLVAPQIDVLAGQNLPGQAIFPEDKSGGKQHPKLLELLKNLLPEKMRMLTPEEEEIISQTLTETFHFSVKAEINGIRLNRNYGLIGGEQHLYRFPGDNLYKHADSAADWAKYQEAGIAPNLGAWGYFASSEKEFSALDKEKEKYYLAVPTFLAPGFAENFSKFRDFFKFRKMLVVNPENGRAIVGVIGDAGPSEWTGKHLGGSPEVMDELGLGFGQRKGAVLYFFIDDPQDEVKLGAK